MLIDNKYIPVKDMNLQQLQAMEYAMDKYSFATMNTEHFDPSFHANPKEFNKLINSMVNYKKDLMNFFRTQFDNRAMLIQTHKVHFDEYKNYLYDDQWDEYNLPLTKIIENHNAIGFDLGVFTLGIILSLSYDYGSFSRQAQILKNAQKMAQFVQETTKKRAAEQLKVSLQLNEDRAALEERLRRVFLYPYRGRFIAQHEILNAYMDGKYGLAKDQGFQYKVALSAQAKDGVCSMVNGEVTLINQPFSNGFMQPLYHFGCLCNIGFSRNADGSN